MLKSKCYQRLCGDNALLYNLQIGNSGGGICAAGVDMFFCWGQNVPTFNDVFLSL